MIRQINFLGERLSFLQVRWYYLSITGLLLFLFMLFVVMGCEFTRNNEDKLKQTITHITGQGEFNMCLAPAAVFPAGMEDEREASVDCDFWIAETPVTYELWYEVRKWALQEGYVFANEGQEGSHGEMGEKPSERSKEPVTKISWYDSLVWCNALSEYKGLKPVYFFKGEIARNANKLDHEEVIMKKDANGFRLPTSDEWELAARYIGPEKPEEKPLKTEANFLDNYYWTPGNYASGATADYTHEEATKEVAWYRANTEISDNHMRTKDVGQKPVKGNGLALFDMSGNVWEWCWDRREADQVIRGGSFYVDAGLLQVGKDYYNLPFGAFSSHGLRFVRTAN